VVYFGGFFVKLGHFAGFSLHIINFAVRISEAVMGRAGDIILIKKNKTKIVRTYGRTGIYMNVDPKWIKIRKNKKTKNSTYKKNKKR
jgi:hypothetical protein